MSPKPPDLRFAIHFNQARQLGYKLLSLVFPDVTMPCEFQIRQAPFINYISITFQLFLHVSEYK